MFSVGDMVVYGNNGICEIMDITDLDMTGSMRTYYVLAPIVKKENRIYSPVDNGKVVMRALVSVDEAKSILEHLSEIPFLEVENEKMIEMKYREVMATCDLINVIGMMKTIWHKQAKRMAVGKKITSTDDRYLKRAQDAVYAELAMALHQSREEVEQQICSVKA